MMPKPAATKKGRERVATKPDNTITRDIWNILTMDSGDTVTNVVSLQIKTLRLRDLLVLLDEVPQSQILNPAR